MRRPGADLDLVAPSRPAAPRPAPEPGESGDSAIPKPEIGCGSERERRLPRKEVIQPQVPLRLPCYDFTPITAQTLDGSLPPKWVGSPASGSNRFRGVTGGVYKARERIHRGMLIRDY